MLVRRITSSLLLAALLLPAGVLAQREPTVQKDLRERFGEWAERFPAEMANYTALETIEQVRWDRRGQQTTPIVAMFRYTWRRAGEKQELVESRSVVKESDLPSGVSASSLVSAARAGSAAPCTNKAAAAMAAATANRRTGIASHPASFVLNVTPHLCLTGLGPTNATFARILGGARGPQTAMPPRKGDIECAVFVTHGSRGPGCAQGENHRGGIAKR